VYAYAIMATNGDKSPMDINVSWKILPLRITMPLYGAMALWFAGA